MFVMGLDIGYSNAKLCFGESTARSNELTTHILPSTASLVEHYSQPAALQAFGGVKENGVRLTYNEKEWIAFVDPARLSYYTRELDANYQNSDAYQVMFRAAITLAKRDVIDCLVIGLPDSLYQNVQLRKTLEASLAGQHTITNEKTVNVLSVSVISQPLGGYMQLVMMANHNPDIEKRLLQSKALIVDPGFFSFDWITLNRGAYTEGARGTSMRATSVFLEAVATSIEKTHGARISVAQLEHALRSNWSSVFVGGQDVELKPHFEVGVEQAAKNAVSELSGSLRKIDGTDEIGLVMIVGGGARLFEPALRKLLKNQLIVVPKEPVLANVVGFYLHGRQLASKAGAA